MKIKKNNYKKSNYEIGDKVSILEFLYQDKQYIEYEIIDIIDKGNYNMYLCLNKKNKFKTTFTDKDLNLAERSFCCVKRLIRG